MKSFGVRPLLLIMAVIVENAFLIGVSFSGAVWAFMKTQKIVLGEFFKLGNSVLTYADIRQDLWLLGISLAGCVLLSSIPVAFSACRPIGKVLKYVMELRGCSRFCLRSVRPAFAGLGKRWILFRQERSG